MRNLVFHLNTYNAESIAKMFLKTVFKKDSPYISSLQIVLNTNSDLIFLSKNKLQKNAENTSISYHFKEVFNIYLFILF